MNENPSTWTENLANKTAIANSFGGRPPTLDRMRLAQSAPEMLRHRRALVDYFLPSDGQVQSKHPAEGEGGNSKAQK
jgi:hypothetical protein